LGATDRVLEAGNQLSCDLAGLGVNRQPFWDNLFPILPIN